MGKGEEALFNCFPFFHFPLFPFLHNNLQQSVKQTHFRIFSCIFSVTSLPPS